MTSKMILIAIFSAMLIGAAVVAEDTASSTDATTSTAATTTTTAAIPPQKWIARYDNASVVCVVMAADKLELLVQNKTHSLLPDIRTKDMIITLNSLCNVTEDMMVIERAGVTLALTFTSTSTGSAKSTILSKITAMYGKEMYNAALTDLKAPVDKIYRCNAERRITINNVNPNSTHPSVTLIFAGIRVQALRNTNTTDLSSELDFICVEDGTWASNIVPIAVGCGLAGLIIIVLIAYMIGRRRAYNHVRE